MYGTTSSQFDVDEQNFLGGDTRLLNGDGDLAEFDRHKVRSQSGSLVGLVSKSQLDSLDDVPFSIMDFRSRASHRVVVSTFGAESGAALETHGMVIYIRAMLCQQGGYATSLVPLCVCVCEP